MSSKLEFLGLTAAAVAIGTVYVLLHEKRRKSKKAEKARLEAPIAKETLLAILNKSADASKAVIERIRVEVRKIQVQRQLTDDQTMQLFQQNFEHSLDQLIGAIRNQFQVSEKAMDASFKLNQGDPEVQRAIQNMRMLSAGSAQQPAGGAGQQPQLAAAGAGGAAASGAASGVTEVPASLTKEKLKEIMTFNAVTLEKELRPIKEEVERLRKQGKTPQVDPQVLMQVQVRISEAVSKRYGVTDEQVMAAVDHFGAKNDPAFKDILQRIATTLSSSLS